MSKERVLSRNRAQFRPYPLFSIFFFFCFFSTSNKVFVEKLNHISASFILPSIHISLYSYRATSELHISHVFSESRSKCVISVSVLHHAKLTNLDVLQPPTDSGVNTSCDHIAHATQKDNSKILNQSYIRGLYCAYKITSLPEEKVDTIDEGLDQRPPEEPFQHADQAYGEDHDKIGRH